MDVPSERVNPNLEMRMRSFSTALQLSTSDEAFALHNSPDACPSAILLHRLPQQEIQMQ